MDGWLCSAVFVPRLVVVTVSHRGDLCLWDSLSGQLQSKHQLLALGKEAPTCSVLLQKLGRMVAGFSGGSLLTVHICLLAVSGWWAVLGKIWEDLLRSRPFMNSVVSRVLSAFMGFFPVPSRISASEEGREGGSSP